MTQSFSEDELDHLTPEEHEDPKDRDAAALDATAAVPFFCSRPTRQILGHGAFRSRVEAQAKVI